MKNVYISQGLQSDASVTWDAEDEVFLVAVAFNRLPSTPPKVPAHPPLQTLAQYFEHLRLNMVPIGLGSDGMVEKCISLTDTIAFLKSLEEKGYHLPKHWENTLIEKAELQKKKKQASWALKKEQLKSTTLPKSPKVGLTKKVATKTKKGD